MQTTVETGVRVAKQDSTLVLDEINGMDMLKLFLLYGWQ